MVIEKTTPFDPVKHGFKFRNSFTVSPSLFGIKLGSWNMGFCGGMCAAALYRYNNNIQIPAETRTPKQGTALFSELLARQLRSIPPDIVLKIYDWQSAPNIDRWFRKGSVGRRTRKEWPALKRRIDAGRPANLILIRVEGYFANLSENHQVVAIGYEYSSKTRDLKIKIYDPNYPNRTNVLSLNIKTSRINAEDSSGAKLRGFFVNYAGDAAGS